MPPRTLEAVLARWTALSRPVRVAVAAAAVVLIGAAIVAASATRDARIALFAAPLDPGQVAEVDRQLAAWNVAFVVSTDNVRVDPARRNDLLLRLALAGIPHAHLPSSNEALAAAGALTPQTVLDAQSRAGLEDDLALALRGVDGVADARVIIAPASDGVFADEGARPATASVRLTLLPGAHMGAQTIGGVRAFVASGVPGLDPSRVTILDDRGVALGGSGGAETNGSDVQSALQSALDQAFGAGSTIVRVHVDVDARTREIDDVRNVQAGGAIRTANNAETYASEKKHYAKSHASQDRGTQTHAEHTAIAAGTPARLSIAVFVDAQRGLDAAKIRALAAAASGFDSARGDRLAVEAVPFARAPVPHGVLASALVALVAQALPACLAVAGVLVFAKYAAPVCLPLLARLGRRRPSLTGAATASEIRRRLSGESLAAAAAILGALPAATAAAVLELYAPDERATIVSRLSRPVSPLLVDWEDFLGFDRAHRPL